MDPATLKRLEQAGVVRDEGRIRVIDASQLNLPVQPRAGQERRTPIRGRTARIPRNAEPQAPPEPMPVPKSPDLPEALSKREILIEQKKKEFSMNEKDVPKGVGLDIGTSFLVAGRFAADGKIHFKTFRDCFLELEPKTAINKKFIQKGLDDREAPYVEKDDKFYVLGEQAFLMANERHVNTRRPMAKGVIAPAEREALPILKEIIRLLVGAPAVPNEKLVFSVPAKPVDAPFDQLFHQDILRSYIKGLGFDAQPMNEAEALAYSELLDEGLTGISISCGAGMMNVAVLSAGDPVVTFSVSKSGDYIDECAARATNMTNSLVQQEKESPELDLLNPDPNNQIHQAISIYYGNLLVYTLEQIAYDLNRSPKLPKFRTPIPLVVAGGTSLPKGFIGKFKQALAAVQMPVKISEVRHASDPLHSVSNGLTLAASME